MGYVNIRMKIMPAGISVNLKKIEEDAKNAIEKEGGKGCVFVQEPIAFGLKAVVVTFIFPEKTGGESIEKEIGSIENRLAKIKDVNSVQMIDMRRAL